MSKHYLIPNVTSAANIGDQAMLEVLVDLIKRSDPKAKIIVHASEPHTHQYRQVSVVKPTLYYWAAFESHTLADKIKRTLLVLAATYSLKWGIKPLERMVRWLSPTIAETIQDYKRAKSIVFVGGGYLRSKPGLKQTINLWMQLLPFRWANYFAARTICAPIGFGPFAYEWQTKLTANVLKNLDVVSVREAYSRRKINQYDLNNIFCDSDHALLLSSCSTPKPRFSPKEPLLIGFTIREWLHSKNQQNLETSYIEALTKLSKRRNIVVKPIVQVNAPQFGEGDAEATKRVVQGLKKNGVALTKTVYVKNVSHAKRVYKTIHMLIGMRMHSNIIAATQGSLFIPVSYEYKTEGISLDLGLQELCLKCSTITSRKLTNKLKYALKNYQSLTEKMNTHIHAIQRKQRVKWQGILES